MSCKEITIYQKRGGSLVTVRQLAQLPGYGWLTESVFRHLIFEAKPRFNSRGEKIAGNGLETALVRLRRRLLIDVQAWDAWIDSHRAEFPTDGESAL
jgi:hypothetical protein